MANNLSRKGDSFSFALPNWSLKSSLRTSIPRWVGSESVGLRLIYVKKK